MSARVIGWVSGVATTALATTATVCTSSEDIPDGATATLECWLQGRETTTGAVAFCHFVQTIKRVTGSGVLTIVGNIVSLVTMVAGSEAALAAAVPSIDASGFRPRMQVLGVALTNIEWFGDMRIRIN